MPPLRKREAQGKGERRKGGGRGVPQASDVIKTPPIRSDIHTSDVTNKGGMRGRKVKGGEGTVRLQAGVS